MIALFCSFFESFDVPVYWPILVVYFFVLFLLTMRRQIQYVLPSLSCSLCPLPFALLLPPLLRVAWIHLLIGWE